MQTTSTNISKTESNETKVWFRLLFTLSSQKTDRACSRAPWAHMGPLCTENITVTNNKRNTEMIERSPTNNLIVEADSNSDKMQQTWHVSQKIKCATSSPVEIASFL